MPLEKHVHCLQKEWLFWFFHYSSLHRGADKAALCWGGWEGKGHKDTVLEEGGFALPALLLVPLAAFYHFCWAYLSQSEFHSKSSNLPRRWNATGILKNKKKRSHHALFQSLRFECQTGSTIPVIPIKGRVCWNAEVEGLHGKQPF